MNKSASYNTKQDTIEPIHSFVQARNSRYFTTSPRSYLYNSYISENRISKKNNYKLRHCRFPQLKIKDQHIQEVKLRLTSYSDLKEITKKKLQNDSLKKQYEKYCQKIQNKDIIEKLKTQLKFFPLPNKSQNKIKHQSFKRTIRNNKSLNMYPNKVDKKRNNSHDQGQRNNMEEWIQNYQGKQKYKNQYLSKIVQQIDRQRQQIFTPLTGWS